jgi:hypothetical protein
MNWEKINAYRILVGNPEVKVLNRKTNCRWVDNIKMELTRDKMVWYGLD